MPVKGKKIILIIRDFLNERKDLKMSEMKKVKFSSVKSFMKGKGFLAAMVLSITAIGISTFVAYNKTIDKITGADASTASITPVDNNQSGVPKDDPTSTAPSTSAQDVNNVVESTNPKVMPIDGSIINPFSKGELVKSKTLGVWKTHDGIDISAENSTDVKSMTSGKVKQIYKDALWGVCVVIDHYDGYMGYYFGLAETVSVKAEQEVNSGDVIGVVGNTADIESLEESHLHFGVKCDGSWIDPTSVMSKSN